MANYQLIIVTPLGEVFSGRVESLTAHGQMGHFGVLPGHAPIINSLAKGVLKVSTEGVDQFFAHQTGVLEVKPNHDVLVLVDEALAAVNEKEAKAQVTAWAGTKN